MATHNAQGYGPSSSSPVDRRRSEVVSKLSWVTSAASVSHGGEPPRVLWRLHSVRGWGDERDDQVPGGAARAGDPAGAGAPGRLRVGVGGDPVGGRQAGDRRAGDAAQVDSAG